MKPNKPDSTIMYQSARLISGVSGWSVHTTVSTKVAQKVKGNIL